MRTDELREFTTEQIRDLPKGGLARKHNCTPKYVRQVLDGVRGKSRSYTAENIKKDARRILAILNK